MSYKPVDLQVSLPRSNELSSLQHQQQQRPVTDQALLAGQQAKTAEHDARRSAAAQESAKAGVTEREARGGGRESAGRDGKQQPQEEGRKTDQPIAHPYKGKHIDLSL